MKITGAVLEESGRPRPYARSRPVSVLELDLDDLGVGQRVVMSFLPRCGSCPNCDTDGRLPCTPGTASNTSGELLTGGRRLHRGGQPVHHHLGVSALADHAVIDRRSLVPVEDDVPPRVAAVLGCAVLTGGGAVIDAGKPQDGDTVLVVGLGGVGMAALITAVSLGRGKVIGIDAVPEELEQALALGADEVHGPPRPWRPASGPRWGPPCRPGTSPCSPICGGRDASPWSR